MIIRSSEKSIVLKNNLVIITKNICLYTMTIITDQRRS